MQQQPQILQEREGLERQQQGVQTPRRGTEGDSDWDEDRYGGGMMGRGYGRGWRHHQKWGQDAMGPGMMGRAGMMGPGSMDSGMMTRMRLRLSV
jgi:hypothetical protein